MAALSRCAGGAAQEPRSVSGDSAALEAAYRRAIYEFEDADGPHRLVVGEATAALDRALVTFGTTTAARLTAANPGSEPRKSEAMNAAENRRLADDLARRGLRWLGCWSDAPEGGWREEGFLVFGIAREDAVALGGAYRQCGILWCQQAAPVELIMLQRDGAAF
jgi:hypothetical protein